MVILLQTVWNRHFFVLTPTKLHYTEETSMMSQPEEDEEDTNDVNATLEVNGEEYPSKYPDI